MDTRRLGAFNLAPGVMCASRKSFVTVRKDEAFAGTRAIPLYLNRMDFQSAITVLSEGPVFQVLPLKRENTGILVTGTEIFRGLIQDRFIPTIEKPVCS
jgi:formylmethanofuran dehydrogenase subunit E